MRFCIQPLVHRQIATAKATSAAQIYCPEESADSDPLRYRNPRGRGPSTHRASVLIKVTRSQRGRSANTPPASVLIEATHIPLQVDSS